MFYKDKGFVLKSNRMKDADKLVTLLLLNNGKTRLVFKGVMKPKSKKVSSAELGTYLEVSYKKKNDNSLIYATEVNIINSFDEIRKSPVKFLYLNYISELFLQLSLESETNKNIFYFLLNSLISLQKSEILSLEKIVRYIEYRLIQLNGIMPDFYHCAVCKKKADHLFFVPSKNHIVCETCYNNEEDSYKLNQYVFSTIQEISNSSFKKLDKIDINGDNNRTLKNIFYTIITNYISKDLKSYGIVYSMLDKI